MSASRSKKQTPLSSIKMQSEPFFMANYYPNECFVCFRTSLQGPLQRCSRCKMIAYCGEVHQKSHWSAHQELCNAILTVLKQREWKIVIFEKMKVLRQERWMKERQNLVFAIEYALRRKILPCERGMFLFPRVCFVCHFSKQEMLTDCPRCPGASFCEEHKSSPLHDSFCHLILQCHDLDSKLLESQFTPKELKTLVREFVINTPIVDRDTYKDRLKLPTSMEEFLDIFIEPKDCNLPDYKIHVSEYLTKVLTVYNALQKVNYTPRFELNIYVDGIDRSKDCPKFWEILLHLLPGVMDLTITCINQEIESNERVKLCDDCLAKGKNLLVVNTNLGFPDLDKLKDEVLVSLVIYFNYDPTMAQSWKSPEKLWANVYCPLGLATVNKEKGRIASKSLKEAFGSKITFVHDGKNEYRSLRPRREWKDFSAFLQNEYLVLYKNDE